MIKTLYHFGYLVKEELTEYFTPCENPFEGREEKGKVLIGEIENKEFNGFVLEDFKKKLVRKYLYRRPAGARGTNIVPTLMINKNDPKKTADKFVQSIDNYSLTFLDNNFFNIVIAGIKEYEYSNDFSYLLTFRVDNKYFGDFDEYIQKFNEEAYNKYFKKNFGNTKKENQICCLTGERSTVYGFVDTLGFSVDSESFRRNGFNSSDAYKMFPVADIAIPILEGARRILLNKLSSGFYGTIKYAIIPHFVFQPEREIAKMIAMSFLDKAAYNLDNNKEDKSSTGFIKDSEYILNDIISEELLNRSDVYYAIMFYEQQQAQFKLILEINDVLPSRIAQILVSKKKAEARYKIYTDYQTKDGNIISQHITLYRLREYFITGENLISPAFYKMVSSIFTGQPFNDEKLLSLVVEAWKSSYKKTFHNEPYKFNSLIKYSLANLLFLNLLGIFKKQYIMNGETQQNSKQDALTFIESHPNYFTSDYLKGTFIFGCLVTRLLYNQPGNAFMKELNGLNINKELITKKFPKLIAKLRQYDKVFPEMESAAERYFAVNDRSSKDELSFAFTMGLVLQNDFDRINKKNQNINNDEQQ